MAENRIRLPQPRNELKRLVAERRREVEALLSTQNYSGAYYLSGYMIELALKVCIAAKIRRNVIPVRQFINSVYAHDLEALLGVSELREPLKVASARDIDLDVNWKLVVTWSEESRYHRWTRAEATSLYEAVTNPDHGVLRWIRQYW